MSADTVGHGFVIWVLYRQFQSDTLRKQGIGCPSGKKGRDNGPRFPRFGGSRIPPDRGELLHFPGKVADNTVVRHVVFFALDSELFVSGVADDGEQQRRTSFPAVRIAGP